PRVCGGTSAIPAKSPRGTGLSPRVRGNLCRLIHCLIYTMSKNMEELRTALSAAQRTAHQKHRVMRDDLLGRLAQRQKAKSAIGAAVPPRHDDASLAQLKVPVRQHFPDPAAHAGAHAGMRIDTCGKLQHGGA